MRIGLIISDFNPCHKGYLALAKKAIKEKKLDKVTLLVTSLKESSIDLEYRIRICKNTINGFRKIDVKSYEEKLEKKHAYVLISSARLKGKEIRKEKGINLEKEYIDNDCLENEKKVRSGKFELLNKQNRNYIISKGLYVNSIVKKYVNEKRYAHCCSVASLSAKIANAHHLDSYKAYLIGMLHDIAKDFKNDEAKIYINIFEPYEKDFNEHVWHQFVGAIYLKRYFKMRDKTALKAIRHHCLGDDNDPYSKIIFIADKLDPSRGYDSSKEIKLSLENLDKGFEVVSKNNKDYLKKTGVK